MQLEQRIRPLKIAILAMGGEGGGVLADWIVQTAEGQGFYAQSTSVPGVAQRTGATIYYVEILPVARNSITPPILALMPTPGDVDVVIASELMEAARAVQRGLVTPDRTLLIASSHRVYALQEKMAMGDGRKDSAVFRAQCERASRTVVLHDFSEVAEKAGSVISSSLFGALAAAEISCLPRELCEQAIRDGGVGVASSLKAFAGGFNAASKVHLSASESLSGNIKKIHPRLTDLAERIKQEFPQQTHEVLLAGIAKTAEYQSESYAELYLGKIRRFGRLEKLQGENSFRLTNEVARHVALWMTYEDLPRVAELKIRKSRFDRVRKEIGAGAEHVVRINEYFHPRIEEIADSLPAALGTFVAESKIVRALLGPLTKNGRVVRSSSFTGFLALYAVSLARGIRQSSLRYRREMGEISQWLHHVEEAAGQDYELACEIAECQRLIKGYSDTHARGMKNFHTIMSLLPNLPKLDAAARVKKLREAALADENGAALEAIIRDILPGRTMQGFAIPSTVRVA